MAKPKRLGVLMLGLAREEIDRAINSRVSGHYKQHIRAATILLGLVIAEYERETGQGAHP